MSTLVWQLPNRTLRIGPRPLVMGIVNVTPDSFSDGGKWFDTSTALAHAQQLLQDGADILDIGGESTRPGAEPVPLEEELRRIVPVVAEIAKQTDIPISIDTMKPQVAQKCLEAGAAIINDVSGFRDPAMIDVAKHFRAGCIAMHMPGNPQTMQSLTQYTDVTAEVTAYLEERLRVLCEWGISKEAICLDPGIGFGKTNEQSLTLLANLDRVAKLNRPVCLGVSRKGFIGQLCGRPRNERDAGSLAVGCITAARGNAHILRVHDVKSTRDAAIMLEAISLRRVESHNVVTSAGS